MILTPAYAAFFLVYTQFPFTLASFPADRCFLASAEAAVFVLWQVAFVYRFPATVITILGEAVAAVFFFFVFAPALEVVQVKVILPEALLFLFAEDFFFGADGEVVFFM